MSSTLISILAAIAAANARVAGMQAANTHRIACGHSIAYDEDAFFAEASQLDQLSIEARNAS